MVRHGATRIALLQHCTLFTTPARTAPHATRTTAGTHARASLLERTHARTHATGRLLTHALTAFARSSFDMPAIRFTIAERASAVMPPPSMAARYSAFSAALIPAMLCGW